ncbi:phospholipase A1-like [Arctopsyche grandis]|uniref:phospholipase A1-like n=1 Tax=Arctopsyche grandis TaxID=121162 RepID=UPI00406D6363
MNLVNSFVVIFCIILLTKAADENNGDILPDCPLSIFDLTFEKDSSNSVRIFLVARNATDKFHIYNISKSATIFNDVEFNKNFKTVLYIHGFYDKPGLGAVTTSVIIETYRIKGGYNILLLDTSSLIGYTYFRGARAARFVGMRLGNVLAQLFKSGFNMNSLDVVGHSIGAHVAGYAGKSYLKYTNKLLPRIIGVDPAGLCFKGADSSNRLDKNDAAFVQVLHTGGIGFGLMSPIGHADFYVNGGRKQASDNAPLCFVWCSHTRSIYIWKYSVLYPTRFVGIECRNLEEVGEDSCYEKGRRTTVLGPAADPKIGGIFYIKTNSKEPYYLKMNSH